jgi:2'-5' RNA ligase
MLPPVAQRTLTGMPKDADDSAELTSEDSAVVVPIRLPTALTRMRRRWDAAAQAGAGPHVTILYPFLPCSDLTPSVRVALAALARSTQPFDVRFLTLRRFPGLVWLEPEPSAPFAGLTAGMIQRWPDHLPYRGAFDEVIVHVTVVESEIAPLDTVEFVTLGPLPFRGRAERLEVWCRDAAGRWRPRWRMPFAG